jgi:hypothetical protein
MPFALPLKQASRHRELPDSSEFLSRMSERHWRVIRQNAEYEDIAMAKDKKPLESLTGIEQEVQITERTKHAMENYFSWLQTATSGSPWSNTDLNKKLLSYATENVTTAVGLVQKLSQAKNLEEVVTIQTEFMSKQLNSFNEQTKTMVELCTKAAQDAMKMRSST